MNRAQSLALTGSLWPYGQVPYDQTRRWQGLYRQDCSGLLCGLWGLPVDGPGTWGGYNTVGLVTYDIMREIHPSTLLVADAIGICGPGTGGNAGHIMWFEAWYNDDPNDNRCWIWEQAGGLGPRRRLITYPFGAYRSWRLNGMEENPGPILRRSWPGYMWPGHYFGVYWGPIASHGGVIESDRSDIKAIQTRLNVLGFNAGIVDGWFGSITRNAVTHFQSANGIVSRYYGEVWPNEWNRLFTY